LNIFGRDRGRDKKEKGKDKETVSIYVCDYCSLEFSDKEHLERHKKVAHKKGR
jgi:uncharacterized Zn-finger protein